MTGLHTRSIIVEAAAIVIEQRVGTVRHSCSRQSRAGKSESGTPPLLLRRVPRLLAYPPFRSQTLATAPASQPLAAPSSKRFRTPSFVVVMRPRRIDCRAAWVKAVLAYADVFGVLFHLLHVFGCREEIQEVVFQPSHGSAVRMVLLLHAAIVRGLTVV